MNDVPGFVSPGFSELALEETMTARSKVAPELFEELFNSSPDSVVVTDSSGKIVEANATVQKTFGYSREELLGSRIELLIPERFRATHPGHRDAFFSQPTVRPMGIGLVLFGRRKDGTEFPVDVMLSPVEVGDARCVLSVVRDISRRKEAEDALAQSEERLRLLIGQVKEYAIFMLDSNGNIATWNSGAERIKGYKADEIIGKHFSQFYTREDIEAGKPVRELEVAAAEGQFEDEGWRLRKDGSRFWANVTITAVRDANGALLGFSKVTRDFTDRKQAEEAIRVSEQRFHSLFEFSPDAIIVTDKRGKIAETNQQVQRVFGFEAGELANKSITEVIPGWSRSANSTSSGVRSELEAKHKDGHPIPVDLTIGRVDSSTNEITLNVIRDLSERVRARQALERKELEKQYLEEELSLEHSFEDIIGESAGLRKVLRQVETVASADATVLILGETGTGKDLIARAIHQLSPRRDKTLVKLNCAAIPTGLLESELFGHEKGAFTGAISQKIGRLELAHHGTLFLDEVGDLPTELQPKILRALQEKEFERLGSTRTIPVDVRLVAATNRNLEKMVADRQFRSDLYYRLRVFPITIPPLRDRREDIPLLASYFVTKHARRMGKQIESIPKEVMRSLTKWDWPGNVRELENFIERAVILTKGAILRAPLAELNTSVEDTSADDTSLESNERQHILRVLKETKGLISGAKGAAARLGLKRTTLNSKLKKLGIERDDYI